MYIIIGGGGKVGYYLAKALINEGHEVLVIEKNKRKCDWIADDLGSVVLQGDACEARTLAEAGTNRADVVVAVTGDDEDNLVICQMAKKKFNAPRAIARINNPKNEQIFKILGIDATVSSTELIRSQIQEEIPRPSLLHCLKLRHADLEVVEATVSPHSLSVGKSLRELRLSQDFVVPLLIRDGQLIFPTGQTILQAGDEVIVFTKTGGEGLIRRLLTEGT
ncbi:MAG: TrkA family potassium uptake protein [Chloroflexi bacterium]|nr:TrkA family potassium uptake protein [Chloroflexota bacterium]MCL5074739.1 TrkA family potassium uptake protein [Chloroflexota bacterium]